MQSDSRLQWIAESVCQSLGVEPEAFDTLLNDEESSNLLSLFLSGEGTVCWQLTSHPQLETCFLYRHSFRNTAYPSMAYYDIRV